MAALAALDTLPMSQAAPVAMGSFASVHAKGISDVCCVASGAGSRTMVAMSSYDKSVSIWALEHDGELRFVHSIVDSGDAIARLEHFSAGDKLICICYDGAVRVLARAGGEFLRTIQVVHAHDGPFVCHRMTPLGETFVTGGKDGAVKLWASGGAAALSLIRVLAPRSPADRVISLASAASVVYAGMQSGRIFAFDAESGTCRATYGMHADAVSALLALPHVLVSGSGSNDGSVRVWPLADALANVPAAGGDESADERVEPAHDVRPGRLARMRAKLHLSKEKRAAAAKAVAVVATTSAPEPVGLVGAAHTWCVHARTVVALVVLHERWLVTAAKDARVCVFDASNTSLVSPVAELSGHTRQIYCLKFEPSAQLLATAGDDGAVCGWWARSDQVPAAWAVAFVLRLAVPVESLALAVLHGGATASSCTLALVAGTVTGAAHVWRLGDEPRPAVAATAAATAADAAAAAARPGALRDWSVAQVHDWLLTLAHAPGGDADDWASAAHTLRRECVDGAVLARLSDAELRDDLALPLGTRKRLRLHMDELAAAEAAEAQAKSTTAVVMKHAAAVGGDTYLPMGSPDATGGGAGGDSLYVVLERPPNLAGATNPNPNDTWRIAPDELVLGECIGGGHFGTVLAGTWRGAAVAVKRMRGNEDAAQTADIEREARLMQQLRRHPNVVPLLGVCFAATGVCIVTERIDGGSLRALLDSADGEALGAAARLGISAGAAAGMLHLSMDGIVHGDLAARNVLLQRGQAGLWRALISDFGLALVGEASSTTSAAVPVGWAAPEVLSRRGCSSASDVFSFGVVLFELWTRQYPWSELTAAEIGSRVCAGQRLAVPSVVPSAIADCMRHCWAAQADERPTFAHVWTLLSALERAA